KLRRSLSNSLMDVGGFLSGLIRGRFFDARHLAVSVSQTSACSVSFPPELFAESFRLVIRSRDGVIELFHIRAYFLQTCALGQRGSFCGDGTVSIDRNLSGNRAVEQTQFQRL